MPAEEQRAAVANNKNTVSHHHAGPPSAENAEHVTLGMAHDYSHYDPSANVFDPTTNTATIQPTQTIIPLTMTSHNTPRGTGLFNHATTRHSVPK